MISVLKDYWHFTCRFPRTSDGNLDGMWELLVLACKEGLLGWLSIRCPFPSVVRIFFSQERADDASI